MSLPFYLEPGSLYAAAHFNSIFAIYTARKITRFTSFNFIHHGAALLDLHANAHVYDLVEEGKIPNICWSGKAFNTWYVDTTLQHQLQMLEQTLQPPVTPY